MDYSFTTAQALIAMSTTNEMFGYEETDVGRLQFFSTICHELKDWFTKPLDKYPEAMSDSEKIRFIADHIKDAYQAEVDYRHEETDQGCLYDSEHVACISIKNTPKNVEALKDDPNWVCDFYIDREVNIIEVELLNEWDSSFLTREEYSSRMICNFCDFYNIDESDVISKTVSINDGCTSRQVKKTIISEKELMHSELVEEGGVMCQIISKNSNIPFTGNSIIFNDNGFLEGRLDYKNGIMDGVYEIYFENGKLKLKGENKNGKEEGIWETYYMNGQVHLKANFKSGDLNGPLEEYYENNQLKEKGIYKHSKKDGQWKEYSEEGQLQFERFFKNGLHDGLCIEYYANLQVKFQGYFKEGKENGSWDAYFDNGTLKETGNHQDGIKSGLFEKYYPNGQLKEKGLYENGEKSGLWHVYNSNGHLLAKKTY